MIDKTVHDILLKEASTKLEVADHVISKKELLSDFELQVDSMTKEAMARQIGGSNLKNSGWNTTWSESDPSPRIEAIKQEIEEKFSHYFTALVNGKQQPIEAGITVSPDKKANPGEPDASIYFRYKYLRTIIPDKDPQAQSKAEGALQALEQLLPGFKQFQQDIENLSIPLNPYYHISSFKVQDGRVQPQNLQKFIQQERQKYSTGQPMTMPDGQQIASNNFYTQHDQRIQSGEPVRLTDYIQTPRIYANAQAAEIRSHGPLMRAIANKFRDGYGLNEKSLENEIFGIFQAKLRSKGISKRSRNPEIKGIISTYENYYKNMCKKLKLAYYNGCLTTSEPVQNKYDWGQNPISGRQRQGLPTKKERGQLQCPNINTDELRLLLTNMTVPISKTVQPKLAPDEFLIQDATQVYQSNGWDSSPKNAQLPMLTMPPIRQLPNGEVRYDRDNGNFGHDHLKLNWKTGLLPLLSKWGKQCTEWLKQLNNPNTIKSIRSPEVVAAIQNVLSASSGNRTGAENLADILQKFPDWKSFEAHHVQKSVASELRSVNAIMKKPSNSHSGYLSENDLQMKPEALLQKITSISQTLPALAPNQIQQEIEAISSLLVKGYQQGTLKWDALTLFLSKINEVRRAKPKVKGNGISGLTRNDMKTKIDNKGFDLLRAYGYPTAKLMDFLYAVMARACHEVVDTRKNGQVENFYGHQYSTSSGKSAGGEVLFSVRYAYFAPELTTDPRIAQMIKNEQRKRHVRSNDILQRQTAFPENAEPTGRFTDPNDPTTEVGIMQPLPGMPEGTGVKIVENIEYFIGQASGSSAGGRKMHKTLYSGKSWSEMVDLFTKAFPHLVAQYGMTFEPMNANLNKLELACKRAVDKVRQGLPVIYQNAEKETTILAPENLQDDEMSVAENTPQAAGQQPGTQPQQGAQPQQWSQTFPDNTPTNQDITEVDVQNPLQPGMNPETQTEPNMQQPAQIKSPKAMEGPYIGYIGKGKNQRQLFKRPHLSSVDGELSQIATKIASLGFSDTASKIDKLCEELEKLNNSDVP